MLTKSKGFGMGLQGITTPGAEPDGTSGTADSVFRPAAAGPPVRGIGPNGGPVWYVSRNADVRAVLSCPFASSDASCPGFPEPEDLSVRTPFLIELDAPRHAELRRLVLPEFGARPVKALAPLLQASADRLIADICASGPLRT